MQQGLFREVALERLSSPDQLDRLLRITDPKGNNILDSVPQM